MANVYIIESYYKDSIDMAGIEGVYSRRDLAENKVEKFLIPRFGDRRDFIIVEFDIRNFSFD